MIPRAYSVKARLKGTLASLTYFAGVKDDARPKPRNCGHGALGRCSINLSKIIDNCRDRRQHIKDGVLAVKQQKTGVTLAIPVHPHLQAVLDATPGEHLTFLTTETGKPYDGNYFSASFR